MGNALFYHLTQGPLERTLPMLLEKSLERNWRVLLRGGDPARLQQLDLTLWQGDDSFLPHGLAGGDHDADQPVLLGGEDAQPATNAAACLICVDGAAVTPEEVNALDRVCILFDGRDEAATAQARQQWKLLTGAGCIAQYWSEETGRWQMKTQSGGAD
ncbi:MAG: DNA polymerase III subunit chi [Celeribacter sp.]|jgi:DNA polymerase-3 subunit chi